MSYWQRRYQQGGLSPIYVNNPNDPRLRAYQDSLRLYNAGNRWVEASNKEELDNQRIFQERQRGSNKDFSDEHRPLLKAALQTYKEAYPINSQIKPSIYKEALDFDIYSGNMRTFRADIYKKPVQPVIYQKPQSNFNPNIQWQGNSQRYDVYLKKRKELEQQGYTLGHSEKNWQEYIDPNNPGHSLGLFIPEKPAPKPKRRTSSAQFIPNEMEDMNLSVQGRTSPNVDVNKEIKTNFSYSYRTPEGGQSTRYFPDLSSWEDFMKDKTYITQRVSGDKKEAQATGYQTGGVFKTSKEIEDYNKELRAMLTRQGVPDANMMVGARNVGDPIPKYNYLNGMPPNPTPGALSLPYGVTLKDIENTTDGYGYYHPQNGNFVKVDPAIYQIYGPKKAPINSMAKAFDKGGMKKYQSGDLFQGQGVQQGNRPDTSGFDFSADTKPYNRQFDPFQVNPFGYGLMAANFITSSLLNKQDDRHYEQYRRDWFRKYSIPSNLQDPNKFGQDEFRSGGIHINPANRGKFTETKKRTGKSTEELTHSKNPLTRKRAIFAQNAKKWHHQDGGMTLNTPEEQAQGYFAYPEAAYLHFPGEGERTFVPGPFPIKLKDDNGVRVLKNKPLKTKGAVTEMKFKEGGEVVKTAPKVKRSEATIEAEKDELIFGAGAPGSIEDQKDRVGVGLFKVGGQKHYNGGTPLKAFPGDFVYSNDPKLAFSKEDAKDLIGEEINKKKLRTPAKLAQKFLTLNENIQNAQDKELDDITKKTAIYNVNNFVNKLADIAYAQEEKKGFPTGVPEFAKASIAARGFSPEGLQGQLNQGMMRRGGEVKKFQQGGVTEEQFKQAKRVRKVTSDFKYIGDYDGNQVYMNPQGQLVQGEPATGSKRLAPSNEQYLKDIIKRDPNLQHLPSSEVTRLGWGNQKDPLWKIWDEKYYQPQNKDEYVFTQPGAQGNPYDHEFDLPFNPRSNVPTTNPTFTPTPQQDTPFDNYSTVPNDKFNVNFPEAFSIYAASKPYKSRYPTAYRNYEIQNAKSLVASNSNQPSVEPYLSAIRRSTLGAPDTQGNFAAGLTAQNQAINTVYNQRLARRDAQNAALANLEVQDGIDRITNFEKYDSKIETLNHNKELADKYKNANLGNIFNQMGYDRDYKRLLNMTSDYYQINQDNSIGIKPAYKIKNGRLEPYQRNIGDMIRQAGTTANQGYINQMENIFKLMRQYGITSLRDVNDVLGASVIPQAGLRN